jgi:hypothetical protein
MKYRVKRLNDVKSEFLKSTDAFHFRPALTKRMAEFLTVKEVITGQVICAEG